MLPADAVSGLFPPQAGSPQPQLSLPLSPWCESTRIDSLARFGTPSPTLVERAAKRALEAPQGPTRQERTDRVPNARREHRIAAVREGWKALRWLWDHSDLKSQRRCSRYLVPDQRLTLGKRAHKSVFKGLWRCKRLDCPVCGPGNAEREAANIGLAVTAHYANDGTVLFVTLTLRHVFKQSLLALLAGLSKSWDACRMHKGPRAQWEALTIGFIRKLEVTFGRNGWHPHLHLLVFLKPGVTDAQVNQFCDAIFNAWSGKLVRLGFGKPTTRRGIEWERLDLEAAQERLAQYVAKDAGRELAAAGTKSGKNGNSTMHDLLTAAAAGDWKAGLRYLEYEDAMKGKARIQWSTGLEDALLGSELAADADEDDQAREIAIFSDEAFYVLRRNEVYGHGPGLSQLLAWADECDDDFATFALLHRKCLEHGIPPPALAQRLIDELEAGSPPAHPPSTG